MKIKKVKREAKLIGVDFFSAKALEIQLRGPSGTEYTFRKDEPTNVVNEDDIMSFRSNTKLIMLNTENERIAIKTGKKKVEKTPLSKTIPSIQLLDGRQLDSKYNTAKR